MDIRILPEAWDESLPLENPAAYALFKADPSMSGYIVGQSPCGCYALVIHPGAADFAERLHDYIAYHNAHGRQVMIHAPGLDIGSLPGPPEGIRPGDPRYAIHSTLLSSYEKILRDGHLKSPARLAAEGRPVPAIGFTPLGEPADFLEYIMFGGFAVPGMPDTPACEIVVNSRLRGEVCYDPDTPYTPQARMYFDAHKIIADGLAVRDGAHTLKVYDMLPLEPYLLVTVFAETVALPPGEPHWTPALFSAQADAYFARWVEKTKNA